MALEKTHLDHDLDSLKIDRQKKRRSDGPSKWAVRWIVTGVALLIVLGGALTLFRFTSRATEVQTYRVRAAVSSNNDDPGIVLNAAGYIVAHHKIQLTPKVIGKVTLIGVEKGDLVKEGQVLVRLEDAEYRAQLL